MAIDNDKRTQLTIEFDAKTGSNVEKTEKKIDDLSKKLKKASKDAEKLKTTISNLSMPELEQLYGKKAFDGRTKIGKMVRSEYDRRSGILKGRYQMQLPTSFADNVIESTSKKANLYKTQYINPIENAYQQKLSFNAKSNEKDIHKKVNDKINKNIEKTLKDKINNVFKYFKKDKPYENAPFRRMMMYVGSGMLLQYAGMMILNGINNILTNVSTTEIESLKGRNYRQSLIKKGIGTENFDRAVSRYSELSGARQYESSGFMASLYGRLDRRNIDTTSLSPEDIVTAIRGLGFMYGEDEGKSSERLVKILSGKLSPEERKEYGISSRNNPVAILKEILETLKEDPAGRLGFGGTLLQERLRSIVSRPKGTLDLVHKYFPQIFTNIGKNLDSFMSGIFPEKGGEIQARWTGFFATIERFTRNILTKENAENMTRFFLDTSGQTIATISKITEKILDFSKENDGLITKVIKLTLAYKAGRTALDALGSSIGFVTSKAKILTDLFGGLIIGKGGADKSTATNIGATMATLIPKIITPTTVSLIAAAVLAYAGFEWYNESKTNEEIKKRYGYSSQDKEKERTFFTVMRKETKDFEKSGLTIEEYKKKYPERIYSQTYGKTGEEFTQLFDSIIEKRNKDFKERYKKGMQNRPVMKDYFNEKVDDKPIYVEEMNKQKEEYVKAMYSKKTLLDTFRDFDIDNYRLGNYNSAKNIIINATSVNIDKDANISQDNFCNVY